MHKTTSRYSGFTLVEMTIVIVIAGLIIAAGLALARPYFAKQQIERTASSIRAVEMAMRDFLATNGRYPCPAPFRTPRGDANDGTEQCTADGSNVYQAAGTAYQGAFPATATGPDGILIGAVPYRALNIPVAATIDAASNRLTFVVSKRSTTAGTYDDSLGAPDFISSAAIQIVDEGGTSISLRDINGDSTPDPLSKHYYFFSHGSDGAGSFTNEGRANAKACGGTLDSENCDLDGRFVAAARSVGAASSYNDDVSNESLVIDNDLNDSFWAKTPANENDIYNLNDNFVSIGSNRPAGKLSVHSTVLTDRLVTLSKVMRADGTQDAVQIQMANDNLANPTLPSNQLYTFRTYLGDPDGFHGVGPRAYEIWEYPDLSLPAAECCRSRFRILSSRGVANSLVANQLVLGGDGNVGLGLNTPQEKLHVLGDFVQDLSPEGPQRYLAATGGDGNGKWTHLGMMDNSFGSTGLNNDSNQYGFRVNWDSDRLIMGLEDNGADRKDGVIGLRTGNLHQDSLHFEIDGHKSMTLKAYVDGVPYIDGSTPVVGHLGVGLTNPQRILDVNRNMRIRSAGAEWWTSLDIWHNTDTWGHNPAVTLYRGRGSFESPTGAHEDDVMGVFDIRASTNLLPGAGYGSGIFVRATIDHAVGVTGMDLNLMTVPNTDYRGLSRMRIFHDGRIVMGNNVADTEPAARLDVQGQIKIGSDGGLPPNCTPAQEGSQRYNPTAGKKYMEFCNGADWLPLGGGFGSDFQNWSGAVSFPSGTVVMSGLTNGKYFVQVFGRTGDEGGSDSYWHRFNIEGVVRSIFIANHPDGTAPMSVSAIVTVNSGSITISDAGSERAHPTIYGVTAFKIAN